MVKVENRNGPHSCQYDTCVQSDFDEYLAEYIKSKGWSLSLTSADFATFKNKDNAIKTGFITHMKCPNGKKSKTSCWCNAKKGKRWFKCNTNLNAPSGCVN